MRPLAVIALLAFTARPALAGMPSVSLTEIAALRLDTISFFLVALLGSAAVLRLIWNAVVKDFPHLSRLTYWRSLGVVVLWGLLFVLVLTMISGARELMTPGAWTKQGLTYQLSDENQAKPETDDETAARRTDQLDERRSRLASLGRDLVVFAALHEGRFPTADEAASDIPAARWRLADFPGTRFVYVPGAKLNDDRRIVAYEPAVHDGPALALTAGGDVQALEFPALLQQVAEAAP